MSFTAASPPCGVVEGTMVAISDADLFVLAEGEDKEDGGEAAIPSPPFAVGDSFLF